MKPFPLRRLLAITIFAICVSLSISNHYNTRIIQDSENQFFFEAPPPPTGSFPQAFLVAPGTLVGLPLVILGSLLESDLVMSGGIILGAAFFWYCVGWIIDCAFEFTPHENPPRFVRLHLRVLSLVCAVLFPFGLLVGMRIGHHYCSNGVPPYWSELLGYGIVMFWISLGASFELLRFLRSRQTELQGLNLDCISS